MSCFGFAFVRRRRTAKAAVGNGRGILCDVYAALGKLHQRAPVGFGYTAEVEKINKKAVDFFEKLSYINITKRNEHELVTREHELDRMRARALRK